MRLLRRNRFLVLFAALLAFCSLMVIRQFTANQSKHIEIREAFILLYIKGYKPEAERLYRRLLRDIEDLPNRTLIEDFQRTLLLVDPTAQQRDNLIWKYHWTVSNELEKRAESTLMRGRKLAEKE
ncbi:MAG TPA: hypothetical protein VJW76_13640 [Verrucomicrobiae bacterium]|nr:hypothetical protein [Verrucomicrobiae bacterium]